MSINFLPSPEPENYEDFKTWSNENIQGYKLNLFNMVEKLSEGDGWNINTKMKANKPGFAIDT